VTAIFTTLLMVLALPALAATSYLLLLTINSGMRIPPRGGTHTRFDVVVPAHNEAAGIARTVESLRALDYPADRVRCFVIADNCTDDTARRAEEAGARVLVRQDRERRGKGYALEHAYDVVLAEDVADAVVVIDADTDVSPNLLRAFAARFEVGADAVQAEYAVRNGAETWRTRLMVVALSLFHTLRSLGRERLGFSCGLRGNGMAFRCTLLRRVPPRAYSLVEDVEYGLALGLAGIRIEYVAEAVVRGEMPATAAAAESQRDRWEHGRWATARSNVPELWRAWRAGGGRIPFDLAADLLVPPLTTLAVVTALGTLMSLAAYRTGYAAMLAPASWGLALACLFAYVCRGVVLSGSGWGVLRDLAWVPVYAAWKLALAVRRRPSSREWVRTTRAGESEAGLGRGDTNPGS
jgi:1,2-diacylglycerol 3-beta-glucosyltransferase